MAMMTDERYKQLSTLVETAFSDVKSDYGDELECGWEHDVAKSVLMCEGATPAEVRYMLARI